MRVLHISHIYGRANTGGAAIAATRLHLALLKAGVESHFVCCEKCEDGPNVYVLPVGRWRWLHAGISKRIRALAERCVRLWQTLSRENANEINEWGLYLHLIPMFGLETLIKRINPDVVHIHWLTYDSVTFRQLERIDLPIVFNHHDFYWINAIAPVPMMDARIANGYTKANSTLFERWWLRHKIRLNMKTRPAYVAPSEWALEICQRSVVGRNSPAFALSNIVEMPTSDSISLQSDKMIVLFGAINGRQDPLKGWKCLMQAMEQLNTRIGSKICMCCFGRESFDPYSLDNGVEIMSAGEKRSLEAMSQVYHSANVLAVTSLSETQCMTKCEALLCGLPVIAFNRTACAEGIKHKVNGWVSADGDIADFAKGVEYFYGLWESGELEGMRKNIAQKAAEVFAVDKLMKQIVDIYKSEIRRKDVKRQ